jgi:hypothetical protein
VGTSTQDPTAVAKGIYDYLKDVLIKNRSNHSFLRPLKKIYVFLFDEAQKLLETHYDIEAFLFRCIRTWLRMRREETTVIAVFSGTSSAILYYTIPTDLEVDDRLVPVPSSRDVPAYEYYTRGTKIFEPFFALTTMAVLKPTDEKKDDQSEYEKSIPCGRPLFAKMQQVENSSRKSDQF